MEKSNKKLLIVAMVFMIPALLIALTEPFKDYGDAIKPGLGDLLNGVIGLTLLVATPFVLLIMKKRSGE